MFPRYHAAVRRLLNLVSTLSLLLFIAVVAAWVRGLFVGDRWVLPQNPVTGVVTSPWGDRDTWRARYVISSGGGRLQWVRVEHKDGHAELAGHSSPPPSRVIIDYWGRALPNDRRGGALGFAYFVREKHYVPGPTGNHATFWGFRTVTVPYWSLASVSGAIASAGVASLVRRRRGRDRACLGLCPACGYNVCATPDRCPECGAVREQA